MARTKPLRRLATVRSGDEFIRSEQNDVDTAQRTRGSQASLRKGSGGRQPSDRTKTFLDTAENVRPSGEDLRAHGERHDGATAGGRRHAEHGQSARNRPFLFGGPLRPIQFLSRPQRAAPSSWRFSGSRASRRCQTEDGASTSKAPARRCTTQRSGQFLPAGTPPSPMYYIPFRSFQGGRCSSQAARVLALALSSPRRPRRHLQCKGFDRRMRFGSCATGASVAQGTCDDPCTTCETGTGRVSRSYGADDADSCAAGTTTCSLGGFVHEERRTGMFVSPPSARRVSYRGRLLLRRRVHEPMSAVLQDPGTCSPVKNGDDIGTCSGVELLRREWPLPRRNPGQSCSAAGQCASGFCSDQVAARPLQQACHACSATGTCLPVTNKDDVSVLGAQTCSAAGACKSAIGKPARFRPTARAAFARTAFAATRLAPETLHGVLGAATGARRHCGPAKAGSNPHDDCNDGFRPTAEPDCSNNGSCDGSADVSTTRSAPRARRRPARDPTASSRQRHATQRRLHLWRWRPRRAPPARAPVPAGPAHRTVLTMPTATRRTRLQRGSVQAPRWAAPHQPGRMRRRHLLAGDGVCCDAPCDGSAKAASSQRPGWRAAVARPVRLGRIPMMNARTRRRHFAKRTASATARGRARYTPPPPCVSRRRAQQRRPKTPPTPAGDATDPHLRRQWTRHASPATPRRHTCRRTAAGIPIVDWVTSASSSKCLLASEPRARATRLLERLCVEGVCCNEACTGECRACTAAKKGSGRTASAGMSPPTPIGQRVDAGPGFPNSAEPTGSATAAASVAPMRKRPSRAGGVTQCIMVASAGALCDGTAASC